MQNTNNSSRPLPQWVKPTLGIALLVFLLLQGWVLLGPQGILSKYTFIQGFTAFPDMMLADPLLTAGLIDLLVLQIGFIVVIANGLPRGPSYKWWLLAYIVAILVYPGLAVLGFLLQHWRQSGQFRG